VDLRPTREFPSDGAAGEGFTNAAEALTDVSPALLTKYLDAARDVAAHAVLLPDGFRFSPARTRRDWTDEETARLREFYAAYAPDGRLPLAPYLAATVRPRDALLAGRVTPAEVATKEKLNPKYLAVLWQTLTDKHPPGRSTRYAPAGDLLPRKMLRTHGRGRRLADRAVEGRPDWQLHAAGRQGYAESTTRQVANDPPAVESQRLGLDVSRCRARPRSCCISRLVKGYPPAGTSSGTAPVRGPG
jgi:hypothetical protein